MRCWQRRLIAAIATWLVATPSISAPIGYEFFKSCDELAEVVAAVETYSRQTCHGPETRLEKEVVEGRKKFPAIYTEEPCFLGDPVTSKIADFDCFAEQNGHATNLECIRNASLAAVKKYQIDYPHVYAQQVRDYTRKLSQCAVSNGDADKAEPSLLPFDLAIIAKLEVGFVVGIGQPHTTARDVVIHGFASLNPALGNDKDSAIEFVSVQTGVSLPEKKQPHGEKVGKWRIDVTHLVALPPVPIIIDGSQKFMSMMSTDFEIRRSPDMTLTTARHEDYFSSLVRSIQDTLAEAGFVPLEQAAPGALSAIAETKERLKRQFLDKTTVYGYAEYSKPNPLGLDIYVTNRLACTQHNGAVFAYEFFQPGNVATSSDFGLISVMVGGGGDCAYDPDLSTFADEVFQKSQLGLRETMRGLDAAPSK